MHRHFSILFFFLSSVSTFFFILIFLCWYLVWLNTLFMLFVFALWYIRNTIMAVTTNCPHSKRKRRRCTVFAHFSRHHRTQTAHRRRCSKRSQQIRTSCQVRHQKSISTCSTVFFSSARHQVGNYKTIQPRACKLYLQIEHLVGKAMGTWVSHWHIPPNTFVLRSFSGLDLFKFRKFVRKLL